MKGRLTTITVQRPHLHKAPGGKLQGPRVQLARGEEWLGCGTQPAGGIHEVLLSGTWWGEVRQGSGPQEVLQGELAEVNRSFRFDLSFLRLTRFHRQTNCIYY